MWAEIWPDIGPRIETVLRTGEATWDEALLLFLERSGAPEETYHTFSYSPLADDEGAIVGMLCVVTEDTERVIGERRLATLRDLSTGISGARTEEDVLAAVSANLEADQQSLPFTLVYLDGHLAASSGIDGSHPAAAPWWPLHQAPALVEDLAFADLPHGAWDRPPEQALVLPLGDVGHLVAALNPYRPFDDGYQSFVGLVANQITAGLTNARAYEEERAPRRRAAGARRGQDGVLHQRLARAADAADAAARPGRGRAGGPRRAAVGADRASASSASTATRSGC